MSYFPQVAIIQNAFSSSLNSSTTNLAAGATFTGSSESTTGYNVIQIILKMDQNATFYVDQSSDGTNWDITDSFTYKYSFGGTSRCIHSVADFYRIRITNTGSSTTTFLRCGVNLMPDDVPMPRSTDEDGLSQVCIEKIENPTTGNTVDINSMGELRIAQHVKLVGEHFEGSTVDTNFWATTSTSGSGAVAQASGQMTLSTGVTSNSAIVINSVRRGRYVGGQPNYYRGILTAPAITGTCVRRWGAYETTTGVFFEYDGTNISVVTRKGSVDTKVTSGNFNGEQGAVFAIDANVHTYEIQYSNKSVLFYIDGEMIHKVTGNTTTYSDTLNFLVGMEVVNSGGNTNNNTLVCRTATINRIGQLVNETIYKFLNTNATTVLKYGAGRLCRVIPGNTSGTVTLYDNTAGSGTQIAIYTLSSTPGSGFFDCPFTTGLTAVVTGGANVTIIYE